MENQYINNLELISSCDHYEKNPYEKSQSNSTNEETSNKNYNNQFNQVNEIKAILDSEFYLIRKISKSSSGKVYLGIHKDSLKEQSDDIAYYSIKLMNSEKIDLSMFKNEIELLKKINHKNVCKIFAYGYGPKISLNKNY